MAAEIARFASESYAPRMSALDLLLKHATLLWVSERSIEDELQDGRCCRACCELVGAAVALRKMMQLRSFSCGALAGPDPLRPSVASPGVLFSEESVVYLVNSRI